MSDLDDFRRDTRAWLLEHAPAAMREPWKSSDELCWGGRRAKAGAEARRWLEAMAARGWTAPTWPREVGGGGLGAAEAAILAELLRELRLRPPLIGFGLTMIGPLLLGEGSAAQKQRFLPPIVRGEIRWCQGYSEPGAGSDLAGLRTQAVRDGETFVVSGQKVWTSHADESDWMFLLVRTDPAARKQDGISFLLLDMESPGVSVRPIPLISGASPFCETFLADVRVPAEQAVGEINGGWRIAKALLAHERTMISQVFEQQDDVGRLVRWGRTHLGEIDGRLADEGTRQRIAQMEIDTAALGEAVARLRVQSGHPAGSQASLVKLAGTELNQRRRALAVEILGPSGLGWEGEGFAEEELLATRDWLRSRANTIEGGTSEIQLNILARQAFDDAGESSVVDDEDAQALAASARDWVKSRAPVRRLRDLGPPGFSAELWREMIGLGWTGLLDGGLGHVHAGAVLQELGQALVPEPLSAAVLLGTNLLRLGEGDPALLADALAGRAVVTLAHVEPGGRGRGGPVRTKADGSKLTGTKTHIPAASAATHVVVTALQGGAVELFVVQGAELSPLSRIDGHGSGRAVLDGVVGVPLRGGAALLERVLDRHAAGTAAELVGLASAALAMTIAYMKTRVQFGVPIATFQALQHRVARLYVERELARAAVARALRTIDSGADDGAIARAASTAFVLAAQTALHVTEEAIQLHGGIGMTAEHDVGLYLKRARALATLGGDLSWHRARIATLGGY